jgi:hypothetical protein
MTGKHVVTLPRTACADGDRNALSGIFLRSVLADSFGSITESSFQTGADLASTSTEGRPPDPDKKELCRHFWNFGRCQGRRTCSRRHVYKSELPEVCCAVRCDDGLSDVKD